MPTVSGIIRSEDGNPAVGIRVQAFDKDMRREQMLGEAITTDGGRYVIEYTEEQFHRAAKKRADLIIRSYDNEGSLRAESEVLYNADDARVDLTLQRRPPPRRELSELELLQEDIEPIREAVLYRDFTDQDIRHLFQELRRTAKDAVVGRRLLFLRLAAYYGWIRRDLPENLDALLDVPLSYLAQWISSDLLDHDTGVNLYIYGANDPLVLL